MKGWINQTERGDWHGKREEGEEIKSQRSAK